MKRSEIPLLIAVFLDLLGFGMIIIDIQFRAKAFGASGIAIGALLTTTFVIQMVISPMWGSLSDRSGRKPILLICTALSGIAMLVYGAATSLIWLFVSRVVSGFGAANVAVAQASISDDSLPENRTAALGRMSAAVSLGLIVGPVIGGLLAEFGQAEKVGYVAGACSLLGVFAIALWTRNTKPSEAKASKRRGFKIRLLLDVPQLVPLVVVAAVAWFSLATLEGTFGQLIHKTLGFGRFEFGLIFGYESFLSVLIQGVLLAWITKKIKDRPLLRMAYVLQGLGLALTPFSPSLAVLFVASTLYAFGAGVANPTINGLASKMTPDNRQGELFGILQGTRSIGFAVGPILGGTLFDWHYSAPYLLAGGVCILASMLLSAVGREGPETAPAVPVVLTQHGSE